MTYPWRISATPAHLPTELFAIHTWHSCILIFPALNFPKTKIILAFTYFPDMQETTTDSFNCQNMTIYLLYWHLQIPTPTVAKFIGVYKLHVLDVVRNACRFRNDREDNADNFCTGVRSSTKQSSAVWSSSGTASRGYSMPLHRRALYYLQLSRDMVSPIRCQHFEMHPSQLLRAPSHIPFITDHLLREHLIIM